MGCPAPLYTVENPVWLSEIQIGEVLVNAMPHGFARLESWFAATPGRSEVRFVWKNESMGAPNSWPACETQKHASAIPSLKLMPSLRLTVEWWTLDPSPYLQNLCKLFVNALASRN